MRGKLLSNKATPAGELPGRCAIIGCGRPTTKATGGFAEFHCRYHIQYRARHGCHWYPTYLAADIKPYQMVAAEWITAHRNVDRVPLGIAWVKNLLNGAGSVDPAQNLKRQPAAYRSKVALARLREASIAPERILATHMAITALIEDDRDGPHTEEYRVVQVAKALHRLASGTHKRWEFDTGRGIAPIKLDVYPKSAGVVLRLMGRAVEEGCSEASEAAMSDIRRMREERFGPHPSRLPGWKPLWQRKREAGQR